MRGGGGRLPVAYQEVEYLETDGNSWIEIPAGYDTTEATNLNMVENIDARVYAPNFPGDYNAYRLFGFFESRNYGSGIEIAYNNRMYTIRNYGYGYFYQPYPVPFDCRITIDTDYRQPDGYYRKTRYLDYNQEFNENTNIVTSVPVTGTIYTILKAYNGCRIKYFKRKLYGNDVNDLVPCYRKINHTPGMYDIVNNIFYTNQGTGEFRVGPNVN